MKPALASAAAVLFAAGAVSAEPATTPMKLSLAYDGRLYVKVLDLHVDETVGESAFRAHAWLKSYGVLAVFKPFDVDAESQGRIEAGEARPGVFGYINHDPNHRDKPMRVLKLAWTGDDVVMTAVPPIPDLGDPPANREQKLAAADPLTQFARVTVARRAMAGCGSTDHFFDGRQRYDLVLGPGQPAVLDEAQRGLGLINPVRCTVRYQEIAGYRRKPPAQRGQGLNSNITAVMAQLGAGGPWVFTSMSASTILGQAQIILRQATVTGVRP